MLGAEARLHHRDEFTRAMRSGTKASRGSLVVYLHPAQVDRGPGRSGLGAPRSSRCGFVVSKAVGGSVVRHRVTRRLRHLCSERLIQLPPGSTLVVRAKPRAATVGFRALGADLDAALGSVTRSPTSRPTGRP